MAEQRKAVIKNADMSESMQQDAVDVASIALSKYNIEKVSSERSIASCEYIFLFSVFFSLSLSRLTVITQLLLSYSTVLLRLLDCSVVGLIGRCCVYQERV